MKDYSIVILLGIVVLAIMVISTPYLLIRGAVSTLISVLKEVTEIYMKGVDELLS